MKSLGNHTLIELYDCDSKMLDDISFIGRVLTRSVEVSGATVLKPVFHKFAPQGVTGVVVIAESHFSIHTWPEHGYAAIDIFTCGGLIDNAKAVKYLREQLKPKNFSVQEIKRGVLNISEEKLLHKPYVLESEKK